MKISSIVHERIKSSRPGRTLRTIHGIGHVNHLMDSSTADLVNTFGSNGSVIDSYNSLSIDILCCRRYGLVSFVMSGILCGVARRYCPVHCISAQSSEGRYCWMIEAAAKVSACRLGGEILSA